MLLRRCRRAPSAVTTPRGIIFLLSTVFLLPSGETKTVTIRPLFGLEMHKRTIIIIIILYPRWRRRWRCLRKNYNLRRCRRRHINHRRRRSAKRDGSVNPVTDWREATAAANGLAHSLSHLYSSCPSSRLLLLLLRRRRYGA